MTSINNIFANLRCEDIFLTLIQYINLNTLLIYIIRMDPIIDRFTSQIDFVDMLSQIGLGDNEINRIVEDGFTSMERLVTQYKFKFNDFEEYLKSLNKTFASSSVARSRVYYSPPIISNLVGCLFYASICYNGLHSYVDISLIDAEKSSDYYKTYSDLRDTENLESEDLEIKIPSLKGASNWRSFRDTVLMKISVIQGKTGFPIDYVLDSNPRRITHANANRTVQAEIDFSEDDFFKKNAIHFGKHFKEDNKLVWLVLKSYLMKTSSYDHIIHIDRTSNGRKAWTILKDFYEGDDFKQRLQDEAFSILNTTAYRGDTARTDFAAFVTRHIKAHKLLIEAEYGTNGEGMDDSTKIQHIKQSIKLEAGLEHSLTSARTAGLFKGTFTNFVSFLQGEVDAKNNRKKELRGASVKGTATEKKNNNNSDPIPFEKVENKIVQGRHYQDQEWKNLTPKQRAAVIRLQRQRRAKNRNNKNNKRKNVSASQSTISKDDLNSISQAIIAGISRGSNEEGDPKADDVSKVSEDSNNNGNKRAKSGQVGNFLSSALRKRT